MATNDPTAAPEVRDTTDQYHDSIVEQRGYDRAVRDVLAWLRAKREPNWRSDDPWRVAGIYELAALAIEAGDHRPKGNA